MDDDTLAIRRLLDAAQNDAPEPAGRQHRSSIPTWWAWVTGGMVLAAWLVFVWLARPVPIRPDDRPIGDIAFLLTFIVLPVVFVLGVIGGASARAMPRLAPVVTAGLVTAVVAAGATEAGFTSFNVFCGNPGYPSCATGAGSRIVAVAGAFLLMAMAFAVASVAARRFAGSAATVPDPPPDEAGPPTLSSTPLDLDASDADVRRECYLNAAGQERALVAWQVRNAVRLDV